MRYNQRTKTKGEVIMGIAYIMLAVSFFGNSDQVQDYRPVHTDLYSSMQECESDIQYQMTLHPEFKNSGEKIICGEVQRSSDY
jgi:hypothetical protein